MNLNKEMILGVSKIFLKMAATSCMIIAGILGYILFIHYASWEMMLGFWSVCSLGWLLYGAIEQCELPVD